MDTLGSLIALRGHTASLSVVGFAILIPESQLDAEPALKLKESRPRPHTGSVSDPRLFF